MRSRAIVLAVLLGLVATLLSGSPVDAAVGPAPVVRATWADTYLPPGGKGLFEVSVRNAGDAPFAPGFTIEEKLPTGVTATKLVWNRYFHWTGNFGSRLEPCSGNGAVEPSNPSGIVGATRIVCRLDELDTLLDLGEAAGVIGGGFTPVPMGYLGWPELIRISVAVDPKAVGAATNTATVTSPITLATQSNGGAGHDETQSLTVRADAGQYALTPTTAQGSGSLTTNSTQVIGVSSSYGSFHVGDAISGRGIATGEGVGRLTEGSTSVTSVQAFHESGEPPTVFAVGQTIAGTGIPPGTTIAGVESIAGPPTAPGTFYNITLSAPATAGGVRSLLARTTVAAVAAGTLTLSTPASGEGSEGTQALSATETTAPIEWDAPASGAGSVQAALEALPGIGAGDVTVSGGPGDAQGQHPYLIGFTGALAGIDVPQIAAATAPAPLSGGVPQFTDEQQVPFNSTPSPFGIVPGSFLSDVFEGAFPFVGTLSRQAGAHPFEYRTSFDLNRHDGRRQDLPGASANALMRTVEVSLPPGLIGNPEALPKCPQAVFAQNEGAQGADPSRTACPSNTQIGYLTVPLQGGPLVIARAPIYNLKPPHGSLIDFGFTVGGLVQGHIFATLDPARGYAVRAIVPNIGALIAPLGSEVVLWGVPGDPTHDFFRTFPAFDYSPPNLDVAGAPFEGPIRPFLTNPTDCGVDNGGSRIELESYEEPDVKTPTIESGQPDNVSGCNDPRFRFEPDIALEPSDRHAGAPTGLEVKLVVPQRNDEAKNAQELYANDGFVKGIATPPIKKTVVTLPEGMTLNPSAGQGLEGCSLQQLGMSASGVPNGEPVRCPAASEIGKLIMHSPDLPENEPLMGHAYIAKQGENPFGSLFALYLVLENAERGVLVKLAGKIELDPVTGQIKTTFDNIPQYPVSDFQLIFKGGIRAALVNPSTCGRKTIVAEYFSWQDPNTPHTATDSYEITTRPDGSPCLHSLSERPYVPQLSAGTGNPAGGAFSPFAVRLTRTDEDQEISSLSLTLPNGLLAKLSGVEECPEVAITQAQNPNRTGAEEQANPSCPAASQIGTVLVGTGTGSSLAWVPGKVYFAGPYKGAPFSLVVVTPAVVGPYDLGVTVVRNALYIDPHTAQATVVSDPFPQILKGIPVRIRDVRVTVDRSEFTFNPTDCSELHLTGNSGSSDGASVSLSDRFQAANCASLAFKPKFTASTSRKTSRVNGASLDVKLSYPKAPWGTQANIAKVKVNLPKQLPSRLTTLQKGCPDHVFNEDPAACPAASRVGMATATTPVLPTQLAGPAYFVSHGGKKFPELIVVLQGDGVTVHLNGETYISPRGITSSTFRTIPDVPVQRFELKLPQGAYSVLGANGNLCKVKGGLKMPTMFIAQNGMQIKQTTKVSVSGCAKRKAHRGKRKKARARHK